MKLKSLQIALTLSTLVCLSSTSALGHDQQDAMAEGPKLENLMRAMLEGVEGTEIIVSRVTIPPNSSLPKHFHPGEEIAYVLKGTVTLWQDGKEDTVGTEGMVLKVPFKQVHTALTSEDGGTVLVFRIHEKGQPERILID